MSLGGGLRTSSVLALLLAPQRILMSCNHREYVLIVLEHHEYVLIAGCSCTAVQRAPVSTFSSQCTDSTTVEHALTSGTQPR